MSKIIRIFCWGWLISFLGSLPLGTLNVAAMQIGIQESIRQAIYFSLGSTLVEMIYVRISLIGIDWLRKQEKLMKIMEWVTFGIVVALAVGSFIAAMHGGANAKNPILDNSMNRFLLGVVGCAVNPVVVVFWFGWSTVLFTKKILLRVNSQYNSYIVGIGLGAFAGNCVFIFGGNFLYNKIANAQLYLHWVIGGIFTLTALIQLYKIIRHKDAVEKLHHLKVEVEKNSDAVVNAAD
jgi:threonine/homoserine/homoserine lactone efflux protein